MATQDRQQQSSLGRVRVAVLVMNGVEEDEITEPVRTLKGRGARVDVISLESGTVQAFRRHTPSIEIAVDKTFAQVSPDDYDALLLPGGALNSDALRVVPAAQAFAAAFDRADKPIAASCHAPWLLASADVLAGRTLTSVPSIHDDVENAGGVWRDEAVVLDGNLVTSRHPEDLENFIAAMMALFTRSVAAPAGLAR